MILLTLLLIPVLVSCNDTTTTSSQTNNVTNASEGFIPSNEQSLDPQNQLPSGSSFSIDNGYLPAPTSMIQDFTVLSQYPELPTGCETTSLTMVLNYNNVPADKCDIADNYLEKGEVGTVDFRVAFEGDPRDENSYGCYAPVLTKAANRYLLANGYSLTANDISGTAFTDLLAYIDQGVPVIVWGTQDCKQGQYTTTWIIDGEELTWYYPEHCMVLLGYSDYQVWVADPMHGEVLAYDRVIFETRYQELFQQAIVIQPSQK